MPDWLLVSFGLAMTGLGVGAFVIFTRSVLVVVVLQSGVYRHFRPFTHRLIEFDDIAGRRAVT